MPKTLGESNHFIWKWDGIYGLNLYKTSEKKKIYDMYFEQLGDLR